MRFKRYAFRIKANCNSLAFENFLDRFGYVLVLARNQPWALFDNGHVRAKPAVHLRKFEAYIAAADDNQMLRHCIEPQHGRVGQEFDVVNAGHVRHIGTATNIEENPGRGEGRAIDIDFMRLR